MPGDDRIPGNDDECGHERRTPMLDATEELEIRSGGERALDTGR
jgi:hypothetical protein